MGFFDFFTKEIAENDLSKSVEIDDIADIEDIDDKLLNDFDFFDEIKEEMIK